MSAHATATGQVVDRRGLGASEVAAAVGLSGFRSPLSVWMEKTGRAPAFEGNAHTAWGQALEPLIRAFYVEQTQLAVWVPPTSLFHPTVTWARCTPDGIALGPADEWLHLVQCKNVGRRQAWRWGDDPTAPDSVTHEYLAQVIWEMFVVDLPRADIVASIGGSPPVVYTVHRDAQFERDLVEAASEFWQCVERDKPPKVDHSDDWTRHLQQQMKRGGVTLERSGHTDALADQLRDAYEMVRRAEQNADEIKNQLRAVMADKQADAIQTVDGLIKWAENKAGKRPFTVPRSWSKE